MSASVASKNLYELLGNDPPEEDQPSKAPRQVIKTTTSSRKRDEKVAPAEAATGAPRGNGRGRGGRFGGNDGAFRDRDAGRDNNRLKSTAEGGAPSRGRGGRGGRGGRRDYDRHSATGREDTDKQVDQGWGAQKGESEWNDEIAAVEIAEKDAAGVDPSDPNAAATDADAVTEEEEQKTKTYDEYLAELAHRQADLGPPTEVRRPNEGSRTDKKWASAKEIKKEEDAAYFAGEFKDKTRTRERKTKQVLDIEPRYIEPRENRRGSGDRGGRGRGDGRGGRGRGDRGAPRSDRGDRGNFRGDRDRARGGNASVSLNDDKAFPALGT